MSWSSQWDDGVAKSQDEMSLQHLRSGVYPPHWVDLLRRLRELEPIGSILEVGCSTGYLYDLLVKEGIKFTSYSGVDTNSAALQIARRRIEASVGDNFRVLLNEHFDDGVPLRRFDVVIDGACIMHVEDWKEHARKLGLLARRELIFSRIPLSGENARRDTFGHGRQFAAWTFSKGDILGATGIGPENWSNGDGRAGDATMGLPRARRAVTYYDRNYATKGALMQQSHGGTVVRYETDGEDIETMWRLGPQRIRTEMQRAQSDITYVDADYYFFGSLDEYYAEIGDAPAAVIPHNMTTAADYNPETMGPASIHEAHADRYGTYNVGMVYFDNTVQGRKILDWWVARCAEWCHARVEDGKFGDQKYLDEFPAMGAKVIANVGIGMGPWSSKKLHIFLDTDVSGGGQVETLSNRIMIRHGGGPPRRLLAYHFSTFRPDRWTDPVYGNCEWARPAYEEYAKAWEALK